MPSRIHLAITGRVQGVFFRHSVRKEGEALGLVGWVRNRCDGSVELVAEGEVPGLKALIEWCQHGPRLATVDTVHVEWDEPVGLEGGFLVRTSE